MVNVLFDYLREKAKTATYFSKVYGRAEIVDRVDGENTKVSFPSFLENGEHTQIIFDGAPTTLFFLLDGDIIRKTEAGETHVDENQVTETYKVKAILFYVGLENSDCVSQSQQAAYSIGKLLTADNSQFEENLNLQSAWFNVSGFSFDKKKVWDDIHNNIELNLSDSVQLCSIDLEIVISGVESCFASDPCELEEFTWQFETRSSCDIVEDCLGISAGSDPTLVLNKEGDWISNSATTAWGAITGTITNQTDLINYLSANYLTSAITSLNGLTGATQTFTNDTNVTIVSGGTAHVITWNGTLADGRIASASTWNAKQNAITTGTTSQYFRGDLSLATFPTNVSSFTNDAGYVTATSTTTFTNKSGNISQWTNDSGYVTGNQTITLSGDVSGSGTTAITTTIGNLKVTNAMLAGSIANAKLANSAITINGTPIALGASVSGLAVTTDTLAQFAATTSSQLAGVISDETGSGSLVFATSPTLVTPILGTPTSGTFTNCTGLPIVAGTTGTLTETRGGTNQTTFTTGDILYASASNTLAKLAIGSAGQILTVASGIPSWAASSPTAHYSLQASFASTNPADATTYYFGGMYVALTTVSASRRIYIPHSGTLKSAYVYIRNGGTAGTTETSTMYVRINDTTDVTISSSIVTNSGDNIFNITGLSTAVTAGDYFEIKWITPTWATNPTVLFGNVVIYIE